MSDTTTETTEQQAQTFTQEDVDRIVGERLKRERKDAAEKQAAALAESTRTADERIADLERRVAEADAREQRSALVQRIAQQHKITDPEDVRLFLTGTDEDTLTAQAKRLAGRQTEQRKQGDVVLTEGTTTTTDNKGDAEMRTFARQLFDKE